jgi:hypothetical protein
MEWVAVKVTSRTRQETVSLIHEDCLCSVAQHNIKNVIKLGTRIQAQLS